MANRIDFFMTAEDEAAFFRMLEPWGLRLYPERFEAGATPSVVKAELAATLTDAAYLLALERGLLVTREIRRGRDRGLTEVDVVSSDVMHYERSLMDEDGALRSGRLWVEFELVGDRMHRQTKSGALRVLLEDIRAHVRKRFHRSDPIGFAVGSVAARRAAEGLVLREAGRKGGTVRAFR